MIMRIPSYGLFDLWVLEKDTQNGISIAQKNEINVIVNKDHY